ncbi:hypothetical protein [Nostoc sp. ChiQUE01b]|uniref:hypothetical protein n=1 Tax=Nostoc sp. ChiQUE01b TaxID=3075376 RepID=UPI002AD464BB|nr:hypothetical protein [Nostoc sp. ChiQUE01b]MDZ8260620.1 hypothetical protein [Nostoc sp. ChiQUE01b]
MAENRRVRLDYDIEAYLKTHADRVLHKSPGTLTAVDYSTLVNRLLYEHKLAQGVVRKIPFSTLLDWAIGLLSGSVRNLAIVSPQKSSTPVSHSLTPEDFSFDAALSDLYEQEAA